MGVVKRQQLKKIVTFQRGRWLNKCRQFFQEKNRVMQSVAAPDDTNPSDATAIHTGGLAHLVHWWHVTTICFVIDTTLHQHQGATLARQHSVQLIFCLELFPCTVSQNDWTYSDFQTSSKIRLPAFVHFRFTFCFAVFDWLCGWLPLNHTPSQGHARSPTGLISHALLKYDCFQFYSAHHFLL